MRLPPVNIKSPGLALGVYAGARAGRGAAAMSRHHLASLCVVEAFKLVVIRIRKLWKLLFPNCREWMSFFRVENIGAFALARSSLRARAYLNAPHQIGKKVQQHFRSRVVEQPVQYNGCLLYILVYGLLRWFSLEEKKAFFPYALKCRVNKKGLSCSVMACFFKPGNFLGGF